ncbi:MFS transporter, partial [bacterium]|nr:MFS transporter [bacterium]
MSETLKIEKADLRRYILIMIAVGMAIFLASVDGSIAFIAIPTLGDIFKKGAGEVSRIILVYLLVQCSLAPTFGKLADIKGPEKIFTLGYVIFAIGSILCALSQGLNSLIIFRFFQGIGGAMLLSTYCAIIAIYLPEHVRGRAFGFISVIGSIGFALGAPIGGFILKYLTWHWLFLINIPFCIFGVIFSLKFLNQKKSHISKTSFDFPGAILSFGFLAVFVFLLNTLGEGKWFTNQNTAFFIISLVLFITFIIRELKCSDPLFDLSIFKKIPLTLALVSALLIFVAQSGFLYILPFFFKVIKGLPTDSTGLFLMVLPLAVMIFGPISGYLSDKKSPLLIASISSIFLIISCVLLNFFNEAAGYIFIAFSLIHFGISLAMFFTANITIIM